MQKMKETKEEATRLDNIIEDMEYILKRDTLEKDSYHTVAALRAYLKEVKSNRS